MKKSILIGIFLFWGSELFAGEFKIGNDLTVQGKVIASSTSCLIIETKDENTGQSLYWIVSEIVNAIIPDVAQYVCLQILGRNNQEICDVVYNGVIFIRTAVDFAKSIPRMLANSMEFIAEKGTISSFLRFSTESLEFALNAKSTLEAYKKLNIFYWSDISGNYQESQVQYLGNMLVGNATSTPIVLYVSNDGVNWKNLDLAAGETKNVEFWKYTEQQRYGFIKGADMCDYQIFVEKQYKLKWNKSTRKYYLETL